MSRPIYDEARSKRLRLARMASTHKCSVAGCSERVERPKFMCVAHWFQVPKALRDEVWAAHRAKPFDRDRSLRACAAAIQSVKPDYVPTPLNETRVVSRVLPNGITVYESALISTPDASQANPTSPVSPSAAGTKDNQP